MGISFKVSKKGTRFRPQPKPESPSVVEDNDEVDAPPQFPENQSATARKRSVNATEDDGDVVGILDAEVSFILNIFPDGYSIANPSENKVGHQTAVQHDPKFLRPYDRTSESLFLAIECGRLPADFLDDIPCKYINGAVVCEVRDYRNDTSEPGVNGPAYASPSITKVCLKMSLENVVKDIPLISDSAWTYGDLMEAESRILKALKPKLRLDPTPNLDRLCKNPTSLELNLNISDLRRKRLRQMSGAATASDNQIQGKVCLDRVPENSNFSLGDPRPITHQPDFVNLAAQNVGPSNMITTRPKIYAPDNSVPASTSVSHQSKYQTSVGNPRHMQDHVSGTTFSAPGASSAQDMMSPYADGISSIMSSVHGKRGNQDGQLSSMANLNKRARSNPMALDGNQQQQIGSHMDSINAPDSHWKNTLGQQQTSGGGIQYPNAGMQNHPQQIFDGSFNQDAGAMPFTMGQQGIRYNLKQEPVEAERMDKSEPNRIKSEMHMVDLEINHVNPQQSRLQQRLPQQFTRSNFPQTPWNNMGQPLENNTRKEEHFQRRTSAQSPRVSTGGLPQSPLSSKSGEFSSGPMGVQFGAVATAALGSSQRDKSAVTSVSAVGGARSLTSSTNDSMQLQHQAQMAANWRSNSLPKTPVMSGVGSPSSVGNMSGPFNASSPVGKEADRSIRDRFSKIEMLTARFQLNSKKNKVDEYKKNTNFPTQQLIHCLFNDHNNDYLKDETCKMPLSKSLVGGNMNICKTRVLNFVQTERVLQGNGFSLVPKLRTRMILSEKPNDGTVAMHYGELDDCDYLAEEQCLPTLPNTHAADLLAAQFCSLIIREGYQIEGDHLQPKPINVVQSTGGQHSNAPGVSPNAEIQQIPEAVSGQSTNEAAKSSNGGTNNVAVNLPHNMPSARMPPHGNSFSQGGLLPGVSMQSSRSQQSEPQPSLHQQQLQQPQQQNQHSLMQQQVQRSSAMMLASNPLSHLNAMGQNSNMQQLGNHMLSKASQIQLQLLQQQQPHMQRKSMMGLGNVGMGRNVGGNNMVGLQGLGNSMGMGGARAGTGIMSPMTAPISGMGGNMGQNPLSISQASTISNAMSQQFRPGQLTPQQAAAIMATKLRMGQSKPNMLSGPGGQSTNIGGLQGANRQIHPGSSGLSMLGSGINRANDMNLMQRNVMAPPKLMSGMSLYMNQQQLHLQQMQQQQESTSPLQTVLSPPQQVGSPSVGMPQQQQASPQQMSQPTPTSPQISSGAIHPPMSAGIQDGTCPASPQLSSQTLGSAGTMANPPMELQGANKNG